MEYIVKTPFIDLQNDSVTRQVGDVINVTKKRHKEITDALGSDALVVFKVGDNSVEVTEDGVTVKGNVKVKGAVKEDE